MKAIINGKRYNTETAVKVASFDNVGRGASSCSDFQWYSEALYHTAKDSWFLAGKGGAMSKYAQSVDQNSWSGGSNISPITKEEALAWLEDHGETQAIEERFSDVIQEA